MLVDAGAAEVLDTDEPEETEAAADVEDAEPPTIADSLESSVKDTLTDVALVQADGLSAFPSTKFTATHYEKQ